MKYERKFSFRHVKILHQNIADRKCCEDREKFREVCDRKCVKFLNINSEVLLTNFVLGHKGFHIINVPPVMSYLINIGLKATSEKIKQRIKFYNSFEDESFDDVIDRKCLPKEYGGTIPMEEMSSKLKDLLKNFHFYFILRRNSLGNDVGQTRSAHEVRRDESQRKHVPKGLLRRVLRNVESSTQLPRSFRKGNKVFKRNNLWCSRKFQKTGN